MPKCTFKLESGPLETELVKITRDDLYGSSVIKVLGEGDRPLQKAAIPEEGDCYLSKGDIKAAQVIGERFSLAEPKAVDPLTGQEKQPIESSFKEAPAFLPATAEKVNFLEVGAVYSLPGAKLPAGTFLMGSFNYRSGLEKKDAAIVANDKGSFLLVGTLKTPTFVGMEVDSELIAQGEETPDSNGNGDGDFGSLF